MKKIYFIRENKSDFGGAEVYLSRLSKILKNKNINHQVINSIFPKFLPSWFRIILFNLQVWIIKGDKFYFSLERILCPDIYRAGDGVHKVFMQIEKKSKLNPLHPLLLLLERRCFNNAQKIIANSIMIKNQIINTYDIDPSKIEVIYNGIEHKKVSYQDSFNQLSNEFKIYPNLPIILYVGSGFKRKGVEEFLNIVSQLKNKDFMAFIIGKEKNHQYYRQLVRDLSLEGRIIFTGPRRDVFNFYSISDIFLFPTHYDPFSSVVLEAMYFGNVVFTTMNNGASEILDKEFVMSNPKDFSVVKKIDGLLDDPSSLEENKQKNLRISQGFSIENNCEKTLELIERHFSD